MGLCDNQMAYTCPRVPKVEIYCVWIVALPGPASQLLRYKAYHEDAEGLANLTDSDALLW